MFEFNYKLFELQGIKKVGNSHEFVPCVKAFIQDDIVRAKEWYRKNDKIYKLWVPQPEQAESYARDYLKTHK